MSFDSPFCVPDKSCRVFGDLDIHGHAMDANDSSNEWPQSGDESEPEHPSTRNVRSRRSQLRPARKTLPFVPFADWDPGQSYNDQPPFCIHYVMEWKLTLNKRVVAKQTEDDLILAPSEF